MPELPEVETIARFLREGHAAQPSLLGKQVEEVHLEWPRTLVSPAPGDLPTRLIGTVVQRIDRRGKFLGIHFDRQSMLIHLRMSGDLLVQPLKSTLPAHTRLWICFTDGWLLAFNDPRKFGRVWLTDHPQEVLANLGPEPLDAAFTAEALYQKLISVRRQLKPLLLDQHFLAGLGNIYTDESLHLAHLHPARLSNTLTLSETESLWQSIREVLAAGIQSNGSSIDWVYRGGNFQNHFRVYQQTGKPCPVCGTPIQRITIGQRGTHFCPTCQPIP